MRYYNIEELKEIFKTIPEDEKERARKNVEEFERQIVTFLIDNHFSCKGNELWKFARILDGE